MDYLERNALRYAAGFVIQSLQKKIDKSAHRLKESVKLCLKDLEDAGQLCKLCNLVMLLYSFNLQEVQILIMTQRIGLMLLTEEA